MKFYAAWYPGDPNYAVHDSDCAMLISVTSVSRVWRLASLKALPQNLMIDSGGFRYATAESKPPSPKEVFRQQITMLGSVNRRVTLCALDHPILPNRLSSVQRDRAIYRTIANAYEFKRLANDTRHGKQITQLAIVQGYDIPSLRRCARELQKIGFDRYGIGSMAQLYHPDEIVARIRTVTDTLGQSVHVFGVSGIRFIREMIAAGAESIDSTTPVTSAKYNILIYSNPYRRLVIANSRAGRNVERGGERISQPLACDCPVCKSGESAELLQHGTRHHVYLRSLHNYWHLARAIRAQ